MRNSIKEFTCMNATFIYVYGIPFEDVRNLRNASEHSWWEVRPTSIGVGNNLYLLFMTANVRYEIIIGHSCVNRPNWSIVPLRPTERGRKCHLWIRNKGNMDDLIATDKIVDMLFVFNAGKYSEKFNFYSPTCKCVFQKLLVYFYFIWQLL